MTRFLSSILAVVFASSLGTVGFAATATPGPSAMSSSSKTSMTCPTGQTYVKAYAKSDGTKVSGHCRSSSSSMMSTTCPKGETWVAPYKKSDGTSVKGYCRKGAAPAPTK